jgi:CubicO group peptidase (beta-lactamase class C family)
MGRKLLPLLLAMAILLSGCGDPSALPPAPPATATPLQDGDSLDARIHRVEHGLVPFDADLQPQWEETRTLAERMAYYQVPGLSIAVIDDWKIEWAQGYGVLAAGGGEPVTVDTLFHAGSIAKPVSAAAVLTLVEGGLLDLDENVNDTLVSWQVPDNQYTTAEKVTLRRLLSHSAGLADGFTNRSIDDPIPTYTTPAGEAPTTTIQQLLDAEPGVDVDGPTRVTSIPGTQYRYANADYAIVELLVVDVTHQPYPDFMQKTILQPLGMTSSTYEQPLPQELRARAATEHDVRGQPFEGQRLHFPLLAAGGMWTTPSDLARFAIEIMRAYVGQSHQILSPETVTEMLTPQIDTPDEPLGDYCGLGFHLAGEDEDLYFQHSGATWGSTALFWAYPERGQGVVVMTNSSTGEGLIRLEILLSVAEVYGWPLAEG